MNHYKKRLQTQNYWIIGLCAVLCAVTLLGTGAMLYVDQAGQSHLVQFRDGYQMGLLCAVLAVSAVKIVRNRKAIRNEEVLKLRYIAANDERARLIQEKVGEGTTNLLIVALLFAMTVSIALFQFPVFFALLGVFLLLTITRALLSWYYQRKF